MLKSLGALFYIAWFLTIVGLAIVGMVTVFNVLTEIHPWGASCFILYLLAVNMWAAASFATFQKEKMVVNRCRR